MTPVSAEPGSPDNWNPVVAAFRQRRVLVLGDVMLDDYVAGDVHRICPEAPVPIVVSSDRWSVLGGAGNVAANIVGLGGSSVLAGVTGDDAARSEFTRLTHSRRIDVSGLVIDPDRPTTVKLRIMARNQQVLRIDTESVSPLAKDLADKLVAWVERNLVDCAAVMISDYGKGVVTEAVCEAVIDHARHRECPVVVDPKGLRIECYRGATVIKPNLTEFASLSGSTATDGTSVLSAGQRYAELLDGTTLLVTCGAQGMLLFRHGFEPLRLAASPERRVYDVTGAGDTVAAALALGLAAGLSVETAVRIANAAASVAVSKLGTSVVTPAELLSALAEGAPEFEPVQLPV